MTTKKLQSKDQRKLFAGKSAIDEDARKITFVISDGTPDRDGDTIDVNGWETDEFEKNPVVLWAHDSGSLPIARAENIRVEGNKLKADAIFAEHDFAETVFGLYKGGFMSAVSVGFRALDFEERYEENRFVGFKFTRQKLMEFSAVPIPSNPSALIDGKSIDITSKSAAQLREACARLLDNDEMPAPLHRSGVEALWKAVGGKALKLSEERAGDLLRRNLQAIEEQRKSDDGDDIEEEAVVLRTSTDEGHDHEFEHGATQTSEAGEPPHVHSIEYDGDGVATLTEAEGHGHTLPAEAKMEPSEEEEEEGKAAPVDDEATEEDDAPDGDIDPGDGEGDEMVGDDEEDEKTSEAPVEKTHFPEFGFDLDIDLSNSNYKAFPAFEAKTLHDDWSDLFEGVEPKLDGSPESVKAREKWAARAGDASVMECVAWRVVHPKGLEWMREEIASLKEATFEIVDDDDGEVEIEVDTKELAEMISQVISDTIARQFGEAPTTPSGKGRR